MEKSIKKLIEKLRGKNSEINEKLNKGIANAYTHTILVHEYNLNIDFIKALETILEEN